MEDRRREDGVPRYVPGAGRWNINFGFETVGPFVQLSFAPAQNVSLGAAYNFSSAASSAVNGIIGSTGLGTVSGSIFRIGFDFYSYEPYAGLWVQLHYVNIFGSDLVQAQLGWQWHASRDPYSFALGLGPIMTIDPNFGDFGLVFSAQLGIDFVLSDVFF